MAATRHKPQRYLRVTEGNPMTANYEDIEDALLRAEEALVKSKEHLSASGLMLAGSRVLVAKSLEALSVSRERIGVKEEGEVLRAPRDH
jgi:hypothetical protein